MSTARPPAVIALVVWTVLVWTTRIRNIVADDALDGAERTGRLVLALSFTALAAIVVVALVARASWLRLAVLVLAGWTVGVWIARSIGIATADHDAAFVAVHLALALISWALAAWAVRSVARTPSSPHPPNPC